MNTVERWRSYINIEQLQELGLTKTQIANRLDISRTTLYKYLSLTPEAWEQWNEGLRTRSKKTDSYEKEIVTWLKDSPDLSSAQVMDWLQERHGEIGMCESTVRNAVREFRDKYGIPKAAYKRQFEAVMDPPMGQQMQVDFGEMKLQDEQGQWKTNRFIAFVLSHSRYKYVEWLDRPFTTADVIASHERAFAYLGGRTHEIVYDQDHLLVVSENHGDILFTQAFAAYRSERKFQIHLCRKQDPQSKGKVESVVKYVKYSFGRGRRFTNLSKFNEACLAWLVRTGNGKRHHMTKKIPTEVFALEKQHLEPVSYYKRSETDLSIPREIRKDNTIHYLSNRYSVPLGTYDGTDKRVWLQVHEESELVIADAQTGQELARHRLCLDKGRLIRNTSHGRDRSKGIIAYLDHVAQGGPDPVMFREYLDEIHRHKPRYIRDQLQVIEKPLKTAESADIAQSLAYCTKHRLYSAQTFIDALQHAAALRVVSLPPAVPLVVPVQMGSSDPQRIQVPVRDIAVYAHVLTGASS